VPSATRFQTAWWGTRTAKHVAPLKNHHCSHRLAELPLPPGARVPWILYYRSYRLTGPTPPSGATPVIVQYWFLTIVQAHLHTPSPFTTYPTYLQLSYL